MRSVNCMLECNSHIPQVGRCQWQKLIDTVQWQTPRPLLRPKIFSISCSFLENFAKSYMPGNPGSATAVVHGKSQSCSWWCWLNVLNNSNLLSINIWIISPDIATLCLRSFPPALPLSLGVNRPLDVKDNFAWVEVQPTQNQIEHWTPESLKNLCAMHCKQEVLSIEGQPSAFQPVPTSSKIKFWGEGMVANNYWGRDFKKNKSIMRE